MRLCRMLLAKTKPPVFPGARIPNQSEKGAMWQDPVWGYYESHGKTEFIPGDVYDLTPKEKELVLHRYRIKEILKKEYLRREYDPNAFRYRDGIVIDPAMFRWYAADMNCVEHFRHTPRSIFLTLGVGIVGTMLILRVMFIIKEISQDKCADGEILWWDRTSNRHAFVACDAQPSPQWVDTGY